MDQFILKYIYIYIYICKYIYMYVHTESVHTHIYIYIYIYSVWWVCVYLEGASLLVEVNSKFENGVESSNIQIKSITLHCKYILIYSRTGSSLMTKTWWRQTFEQKLTPKSKLKKKAPTSKLDRYLLTGNV